MFEFLIGRPARFLGFICGSSEEEVVREAKRAHLLPDPAPPSAAPDVRKVSAGHRRASALADTFAIV